ncbi:Mechanosensitive ion channel [Spirosomataceae bacterium TFI 002]|nr:Mechanosensitive ion channel [Spirosomataceae bacterium TFI 002]
MIQQLVELLEITILHFGKYKLQVIDIALIGLIFFATRFVLFIITKLLNRLVIRGKMEDRNKKSIMLLLRYFLSILAIVAGMEVIGIEVTLLLAGSAALLVGLGLGLQQIFSDIISGIILLAEGSVKIGDIMEVDGLIGKVTTINLRTSEILTRDGIVIIVPNHKFIVENVINWSHNANITRFNVTVGVAYGTDPNLVKEILIQCAHQNEDITSTGIHAPNVRLINFGDSSLDFELLFWSQNGFTIENTKSNLRFLIVQKFKERGVEIPFPQRDLHLKSGKF